MSERPHGFDAEWLPSIGASIALFAGFFGVYLAFGLRFFADSPWRNDEFFEIDAARIAEWMLYPEAIHLRTRVHPIYVLLVNPLATGLKGLLGSPLWTVQVLTAGFAAAAVAISYLAVLRWKRDPWLALGLAGVLGCSATQSLLGVVPETTSLATCALALALWLCFRDREAGTISFAAWAMVGVLGLGVTTTNIVPVLCLFGATCWTLGPRAGAHVRSRIAFVLGRSAGLAALVLVATAGLALVQNAIYPNSKLFFRPELVRHEIAKHSSLAILEEPAVILGEVAKHFLVATIVAPLPREIAIDERPAATFVGSWLFSWPAVLAGIGWAVLCGSAILRSRGLDSADRALVLACGFALAFQLLMHCFYGVAERGKMEFFLYTGNAELLVIMLAASGLRASERFGRALLVGLVLSLAAASVDMLDRVAWIVGRSS